jgi:hypothetical protein
MYKSFATRGLLAGVAKALSLVVSIFGGSRSCLVDLLAQKFYISPPKPFVMVQSLRLPWNKGYMLPTLHLRTVTALALKQQTHLQVYKLLQRRASSNGLLAPKTRPLAGKLEAFIQILLYYMRDRWGGSDEAQCTSKMLAAANRICNGVESG